MSEYWLKSAIGYFQMLRAIKYIDQSRAEQMVGVEGL